MKNSLFKKFMEFGIGSLITLILGFITSPIITRVISPEQNGKFSMFTTVTNLLMVIAILGLDQSYVRYYYEELKCNRSKLMRSCIKIPLITTFILSILIVILFKPVSFYIVREESLIVAVLLCINLFIAIVSRFFLLQIRMQQRAKLYSLLNIILKIVNLIFIICIFFIYKNNYITLIMANTIAQLLLVVIAFIIQKKERTSKSGKATIAKQKELKTKQKELLNYGLPLVFSMAATWIFQSIDRITIKEFSGYAQVGLYSGAMTIVSLLNTAQSAFTTFWAPVAFERYSKEPNDKEFFKKINKIVTFAMLVIAICLIAFKDLIVLLLGVKYRECVYIFPYLVFMPIMYTISETTVIGISFKKKPKYHLYISIICAVINFIGNMILVPYFGATGAAISTGFTYIIFFIARTYYSVRLYRIDYSLGKFFVAIILVYILATYSSFYKFNIYIFILTLINLITVVFLYNDVLCDFIEIAKTKIRDNRIKETI